MRTTIATCSLLLCAAVGTASAARAQNAKNEPRPRRIAVSAFDAPSDSHARQAVLAVLSDHPDVQVVSLDDVEFAAKRVKADIKTPAGRRKVAAEMGIDAFIDATVGGSHARLTLDSVDGAALVTTEVDATTPKLLDAIVGERLWAAMGPRLSKRESVRRALLDQAELARKKIAERKAELVRQQELAQQRAKERAQRLQREHALALQRRAAIKAELAHQAQLVQQHNAELAREQQRAEQARLAQAAAQRQAGAQPTAAGAWANRPNGSASPPPAPQVSNATRAWLERQGVAPAPAPNYRTIPYSSPAAYASSANGISPATQRWMEQQQQSR